MRNAVKVKTALVVADETDAVKLLYVHDGDDVGGEGRLRIVVARPIRPARSAQVGAMTR